jgi:hypothetical protein
MMLMLCRQQRLQQLREQAARPMFGKVGRIAREQFVREVTEASRDCWVVVHLFQDKCGAPSSSDDVPCLSLACPGLLQQAYSTSLVPWTESLFPEFCMGNAAMCSAPGMMVDITTLLQQQACDSWACMRHISATYPVRRVLGCQVLRHCLEQLAAEFAHVKFLAMLATDCIPGYPDTNLPTVLVYQGGQCARTLVGLQPFGGSRLSPESAHTPSCTPHFW